MLDFLDCANFHFHDLRVQLPQRILGSSEESDHPIQGKIKNPNFFQLA